MVSNDRYEAGFKFSMLTTVLLTEGREAIRKMAMLDVFLQTFISTIDFLIAKKLPCPLHDMLPEKFMPLVQCIGGRNRLGSANFQSRQKVQTRRSGPSFPAPFSYRAMFDG